MYTIEDKILIWLSTFECMTYKKVMFILNNFELEDFFENLSAYRVVLDKFTNDDYHELMNSHNLSAVDRLIENYEKSDIKMVTIKSENYPELLKEIDTPPIILYCKGDISLLNSDCLGVVGSRRATKYASTVGYNIVRDVAMENITIVSGLADGADTIAHKACLEANGKTIAVLGGGILNIYPSSNTTLANDIVEKGGLLISEYKPSEQSLTFHFPVRNRIIAGLSKGVFIIEATEKSGSMHTKNYALEYNREVFALPAKIGDIYSEGCNKIIQNGQAKMVLKSEDITELFGKTKNNLVEEKSIELSFDEQIIYDALVGEELHFDEIIEKTHLDAKVLLTMLMRMEIKGIVNKLPGNIYKINKI